MTIPSLFYRYRFIVLPLSLGLLIALIAVATFWFGSREKTISVAQEVLPSGVVLSAETEPLPDDPKQVGILLLGYGGAGHQGGMLADVIQLVYLDVDRGKVFFIAIPRDLWVTLPTGHSSKINQALTLGTEGDKVLSGAQVAKVMASQVTGLKIQYVVAVDFVNFQRLIGYGLDGIEVQVTETLDDPWYPVKGLELETCGMTAEEVAEVSSKYSGFELEKQFPCRYEHLHFEPGTVKMEGGDALKYVRSRHGSGAGDFSRNRRQQEVLVAIRNKLFSQKAWETAPKLFEGMKEYITTDVTADLILPLAGLLQKYGQIETTSINLTTENVLTSGRSQDGQSILIPKAGQSTWQEVHKFIETELNK